MPCQRLSSIYAPVLPAGATKIYHKRGKASFYIIGYGNINKGKNAIEKNRHLRLLFQKIFHRFIQAVQCFIFIKAAGV